MGSPKPCLGCSSRTAAVRALRKQGLSTAAIAGELGISQKNVALLGLQRAAPKSATRIVDAVLDDGDELINAPTQS